MARFRVEFDRNGCIGAGPCAAVAPDLFEIGADTKANLIGGKLENGVWVKEIDAVDEASAMEAVSVCPVAVIVVRKLFD